MDKAFPFDTENFRNFKPKVLAKWKAPQKQTRNTSGTRLKTALLLLN